MASSPVDRQTDPLLALRQQAETTTTTSPSLLGLLERVVATLAPYAAARCVRGNLDSGTWLGGSVGGENARKQESEGRTTQTLCCVGRLYSTGVFFPRNPVFTILDIVQEGDIGSFFSRLGHSDRRSPPPALVFLALDRPLHFFRLSIHSLDSD